MAGVYSEKQLFQGDGDYTTASTIHTRTSSVVRDIVGWINLANNTSTAITVDLYHDEDGSTYDDTTVLMEAMPIDANSIIRYSGPIYMVNAAATIGVKCSVSGSVTITGYGASET
jgi:hypothetical protein